MKNTIKILSLAILLISCAGNAENNLEKPSESISDLIEILDSDENGYLNPYEALDVLLQLQKENKGDLAIKDFKSKASEYLEKKDNEILDIFNEVDQNKDGEIQFDELNSYEGGFIEEFADEIDTDNDKLVTFTEMKNFDFTALALASEDEINERINTLFKEYDNKAIDLAKVDKDKLGRYTQWDENRDGKVTKEEAHNYITADNIPVEFTVKGTTAYMTGVITSSLPSKVLQLIFEHPEVSTIEMITVPGSIDDEANLRAGLYVYERGLTTKLNSRSAVASGGTDFFLAGKQRIVEQGAVLGVHSWGGGNVPATEVPKEDPVHTKYLEFYEKVDVPTSFYWYTLEVAPAENMHTMTEEEIKKYNVRKN